MPQSHFQPRVALVTGASGVVGRRTAQWLSTLPGWRVIGVARRAHMPEGDYAMLAVDLADPAATRALAQRLCAVTHIFSCARFAHSTQEPEPIDANLAMLRNVVEVVEGAGPGLKHVHLVQGSKYYGSELGEYKTPAKETDPRVDPYNWYYAQEDWLIDRARGRDWNWSASRPHGVCDHDLGIVRSMARVIAVYAAILKDSGAPLYFPGSEANYRALYQCTDAALLARAIHWIATEAQCANEAFNVNNGDLIRWMNVWPNFARVFGMEPGGVRSVNLPAFMADKAPVWERIVSRHGLAPTPFAQTALWAYGDFIFNSGYDIISDTQKLRRHGFWETLDTESMFLRLFDHFRRNRIVP